MNADDEKILRLAKEIVIKFIEIGRVSPNTFDHQFKGIFWAIKNTVVNAQCPDLSSALTDSEGRDEQ